MNNHVFWFWYRVVLLFRFLNIKDTFESVQWIDETQGKSGRITTMISCSICNNSSFNLFNIFCGSSYVSVKSKIVSHFVVVLHNSDKPFHWFLGTRSIRLFSTLITFDNYLHYSLQHQGQECIVEWTHHCN